MAACDDFLAWDDEPTDEECWIAPSLCDSYIILRRAEKCTRCPRLRLEKPWPQRASGACQTIKVELATGLYANDILDLTDDQCKELSIYA